MRHDLGLFVLRVFIGSFMLFSHGIGKLSNFSEMSSRFPDLLGFGSSFSLSMAIFSEVFCSAALIVGVLTRWVSAPLLITMLVAAFVVHGNDPWGKKEFALLYAIPFLTLMLTGGGKYSLDHILGNKRGQ